MPRVSFADLPDHGRLWVFPINRDLDESETERCLNVVDGFLAQWAAHGTPLRSARDFRDSRFLLIGVDVDAEAPSGCSIDALVNQLKGLGDTMGITFIDHAPVWFRDDNDIQTRSRSEFRTLAASGGVTRSTHVFDTSLVRIGQARSGELERPASETWHGRAFFKERAAT